MSNEELALRIQEGERELFSLLWERVERLIRQKAGRFYRERQEQCAACGCTVEDLQQAGFLALVDAVAAFDPRKGYRLITWLGYPLLSRWREMVGQRTSRTRQEPLNRAGSLDEPVGEEGDSTKGDFVTDPNAQEAFEQALHRQWITQLRQAEEEALDAIPPDCAQVIRCRYFQGKSLREQAAARGEDAKRLRYLENKGLRQLWRPLRRWREEVESLALRGTGLTAFRQRGSATERAVEWIAEREQARSQENRNKPDETG